MYRASILYNRTAALSNRGVSPWKGTTPGNCSIKCVMTSVFGTCPVTKKSGKQKVVIFRRGCDREFRRIVQQFAKASVRQSGWALAYWRDVRPRCRSDSDAYRRLANRWLAIIWKMWQDGKAYDETYHIQQRAQRRRPRS
jgi:hypothetical protein